MSWLILFAVPYTLIGCMAYGIMMRGELREAEERGYPADDFLPRAFGILWFMIPFCLLIIGIGKMCGFFWTHTYDRVIKFSMTYKNPMFEDKVPKARVVNESDRR